MSNTAAREMTIVAIVDQVITGDLALAAGAHAVVYSPFTAKTNAEFRNHLFQNGPRSSPAAQTCH